MSTRYRELAALAEAAAVDVRGRAGDFEDERRGALVNHMLEMYSGRDVPIGAGAERLYEALELLTEDARRAVRIKGRSNVPPAEEEAELIMRLRQFAVKHYLEPHPAGHSHCGCDWNDPAALAKAVCLQRKKVETGVNGDTKPDPTFARLIDCLGCSHIAAFQHNRRVVDGMVSATEEAARAGATQDQVESAKLKLASLKAGIAKAEAAVHSRPTTPLPIDRM